MRRSALARSVNRDDAVRLSAEYLGGVFEKMRDRMQVRDIDETCLQGRHALENELLKNCWVVYLPNTEPQNILSPSRILCIEKSSGQVIYDGSECGKRSKKSRGNTPIADGCR